MTSGPGLDLAVIAAEVEGSLPQATADQRRRLDRLREQKARLGKSVFQLAVLGQFKRGKSTLLNAFVGYPLLSAGVLPLTAVPTFLSASATERISLKYLTGEERAIECADLEALAAEVAAATTEEQNPRNEKGLQRVEVAIPSTRWLERLTLIDTPGIGSTYTHNTEAAREALPECDAALFVTSIDPPITEVELRYLAEICGTASRVIVVLNKVDLADEKDSEKAAAFLSSVLAHEAHPQIAPRIFPVSARLALAARRERDAEALRRSGLPELEAYIQSELVDQKHDFLTISIAKKMADIVDALKLDAAMTVRALTIPLSELDEKIAFFETASAAFERERADLEDLMTGEWRRTVARLDQLCDETDKRAQREIEGVLAKLPRSRPPDAASAEIGPAMAALFDREFGAIAATVDAELNRAAEIHQQRYRALAARVAETAAGLFDSAPAAPQWEGELQIDREPYWVGQMQVESLTSLTADGVARFLPRAIRERRQQAQLRAAVMRALTRNISDLHWAMRQNIDDSFRRLLAASNVMVETSLSSTRELLMRARERRRSADASLHQQIESARASESRLAELRRDLAQRLQA